MINDVFQAGLGLQTFQLQPATYLSRKAMHEYPYGLPWFLRPSHWFLFERPVLSSDIDRVFIVLLTLNSWKDRCASNEHACSRTATPPAAKATPRVGGAQMKGFGEIRTIPVCSHSSRQKLGVVMKADSLVRFIEEKYDVSDLGLRDAESMFRWFSLSSAA